MPHLAGFAAIIFCAASPWASAADGEWSKLDSGSWSTPENWASEAVADGEGFTAKFDGNPPEGGLTVTLDSPRTIGHLIFADSTGAPGESWILRGDAAAGNTLTLAGPSPSIYVETTAPQRHIILDVDLAGTGGFIKTGPGVLNVVANTTCTGPILIEAGTVCIGLPAGSFFDGGAQAGTITINNSGLLFFDRSNVFGGTASPVSITINAGAIVSNHNVFNTLNNLHLNGGRLFAQGGQDGGSQAFALVGTVAVGGGDASSIDSSPAYNSWTGIHLGSTAAADFATTFEVADVTGSPAADLTVSAVLMSAWGAEAAGDLTKTGPGTMALSAANTYAGNTAIAAGTLALVGEGSISSSSDISIARGATWDVSEATLGGTVAGGQKLSGEGRVVGRMSFAAGSQLSLGPGPLTFAGDLTLSPGSVTEIHLPAGGKPEAVAGGPAAGTIQFGGSLVLVFPEGFSTAGTTKLFDFKSGDKNFEEVRATGLAPGFAARFDPLTGSVSVVSAAR
jgi:autotransporter-associated beta strand protein